MKRPKRAVYNEPWWGSMDAKEKRQTLVALLTVVVVVPLLATLLVTWMFNR